MVTWGCLEITVHLIHLHSTLLPEISACPTAQVPKCSEIREVATQQSCSPPKVVGAAGVTELYFISVT